MSSSGPMPDATTDVRSDAPRSMLSVAFWSFLLTQFLGALNDNYFKQMVLLTCVSQVAKRENAPYLPELAQAAFALPFVLLSGFGGFLSDRCAKTRVIVGCKFAEVGIMGVGLLVLRIEGLSASAQIMYLIGVLLLMGAHSAIFAPSKYGVLPELFREDQLLPVNGAVQMTTFMAIILGMIIAGIALDQIQSAMWIGSLIAVGIAAAGTVASLFIPRAPIAQPGLKLKSEDLFLPRDIAQLLRSDRRLLLAILIASVFWFLGGVTQISVNTLGKATLRLSDTRTSLLLAGICFGIMAGCIIAGFLGKGRSGSRWVLTGSWLLLISLSLIAFLGSGLAGTAMNAGSKDQSIMVMLFSADLLEWSLRLGMVFLGVSAGMFVVPVQVFLQQAPPPEYKGRLLGVQNLVTWIGILLSAAFVGIAGMALRTIAGPNGDARHQWAVFASLALLMVPVCLFYRLPEARRREL